MALKYLLMGRKANRQRQYRSHAEKSVMIAEQTLDDLLEHIDGLEHEPFVLVLDGLQDPGNLGAVLRSASGAGIDAVLSSRKGSCGITETVRRVAAGGADHLLFVQVNNLGQAMDKLRERGILIVGSSDRGKQNFFQVKLTGPLALVMGSEGYGVRKLTAEKCDQLVRIPMLGEVECLNVSVATGVMLFEAVRQRLNAAN